MIYLMDESSGNALGIRATGKLSVNDYRDVLAAHVDALLQRFPKLRVLFLMDEAFEGWSLRAAWVNTVFDFRHRRDFEKIAMVGAPKWEQWCLDKAAALLLTGELRTFRRDQLAQAWEWLRA